MKIKKKKKYFFFGGGGGCRVRGCREGGGGVDVNGKVKLL